LQKTRSDERVFLLFLCPDMTVTSRLLIGSLLTAIALLLLGLAGVLWVGHQREQRYRTELDALKLEMAHRQKPPSTAVAQPALPAPAHPDTADGWGKDAAVDSAARP
jgi:hypothetical protein